MPPAAAETPAANALWLPRNPDLPMTLIASLNRFRSQSRGRDRRSRRRRLSLESLEGRRLLAVFEVTTLRDRVRDDDETSLREAIDQANQLPGRDEITFDSALFSGGPDTLTLDDDNPVTQMIVEESIDIIGPGADLLTIDADQHNRHFLIESGTTAGEFISATISGMTLTGGQVATAGGAILIVNAEVSIIDSEIVHSEAADDGGGVLFVADNRSSNPNALTARLEIRGSTIAHNSSGDNGGGISVLGLAATAPVLIENSTISDNLSDDFGGGLFVSEADASLRHVTITNNHSENDDVAGTVDDSQVNSLTLQNSIVAGNYLGSGTLVRSDIAIPVESDSVNNVIGDADSSGGLVDGVNGNIVGRDGSGIRRTRDIIDLSLELNGGTTRTHALAEDSPAIDAAAVLTPPVTVDQRGVSRPQASVADIGAFEERANTPPTISDIADQTVDTNMSTAALMFTISDLETAAGDLLLSATSSNPSLVTQFGMVFGGSGTDRTITVTPAFNQSGTTTISVTVTDEAGLTNTDTFVLTVTAPNTAPLIEAIPNQTIRVNESTPELSFVVSDSQTAAADLVVAATSSDSVLIPPSGIALGGSGGLRTITITPATDQIGTATIMVTVTDEGGLSSSSSFQVTVNALPAPMIRTLGPGGAGDPPDLPRGPQPTSWAIQRSDIRELVIELPNPISAPTAADVVLTNLGVDAPNDPDVVVTLDDSQLSLSPDGLVLTISFSANQLDDGVYQLELLSTITGGDAITITGSPTNRLFVLTGDWNGSGGVNIQDFATFAYWFGNPVPTAPDYVDPNGTGGVNIQDFALFAGNFGRAVTFPPAPSELVTGGDGEGEYVEQSDQLRDPLDVNQDGAVTAADALVVVNALADGPSDDRSESLKYDTNGDGRLTPQDALAVINRIAEDDNSRATSAVMADAIADHELSDHDDELERILELLLLDRRRTGLG